MMTVQRKEIECHDLPFKIEPDIHVNSNSDNRHPYLATVSTTAENVPEDCSDIQYYFQCPEYIHSIDNRRNTHLPYSDNERWMNPAITEACCICGGGSHPSSLLTTTALLSSPSHTYTPMQVEHARQLLEVQSRGLYFYVAWGILIIIGGTVHVYRKLKQYVTGAEAEAEQEENRNGDNGDIEINDNITISNSVSDEEEKKDIQDK